MSNEQPEQQSTQETPMAPKTEPGVRRQLVTKAAMAAVGGVVSVIARGAAEAVWKDVFGGD
ncbi:hypothetical protein [Streptomyces griseofuscus]|uniref:hypothetical protein n=1 Tax=Streptomyces griseofuscus TaxID=146922 RepID=UPI0034067B9E